MRLFTQFCGALAAAIFALQTAASAEIVINEIMYHPASENVAEEYIELYNTGDVPVDLSGWGLISGVSFTFPAGTTIAAGGYLVIAADPAGFSAAYPGVSNFVAGWTGRLSNSSERIRLANPSGTVIDQVTYADDGDWAIRSREDPPDHGHRGWVWRSGADGRGRSLELINPRFDNDTGQNWADSTVEGGTPGAANSVLAADIPPVIRNVEHFPLVPKSHQQVTVIATVSDDSPGPHTVTVRHRIDGAPAFDTVPMFDDGAHGDGIANDGIFAANLPAWPAGTIVEFYISATDSNGKTRTWPAPARDYTGAVGQFCNALYQVDDKPVPDTMPVYRIVMRAADRAELLQINRNSPAPPFPLDPQIPGNQVFSHSRFNATFISFDGKGASLRYLTGVRNRGNGSRTLLPQSLNVGFNSADPWHDCTGINLNSQYSPIQVFGSALYRAAGLVAAESRPIQFRINGENPASATGAPAYGFYAANQVQDSRFVKQHFRGDDAGNLYRATRLVSGTTAGGTRLNGGDLALINPGPTETLSLVELYKLNYTKRTNETEDDWSDLLALTAALAKGHSDQDFNVTYAPDFVEAVEALADVQQWMRFMAVNTLADNNETNLSNGDGDDYYIYFGANDPRARLVPYDLDTIVGRSGGGHSATHSIWRMVTDFQSGDPMPLNAFMKHPKFAPIYYAELKRLLDGVFHPSNFDPLVDNVLGPFLAQGVRDSMKSFNASRHAYVASQIPLEIRVTNSQNVGGSNLPVQNGYPRTTTATCRLLGQAHAIDARSVKVNGADAAWTQWSATWNAEVTGLLPGLNRILIQAFDSEGKEIDRRYHTVWYDDGTVQNVSGTIAGNVVWTAANGPYQFTGSVTVANGAVLTIEPGTTIYLGSGHNLTVAAGGQLIANGTELKPIRFSRAPGSSSSWGGIVINGPGPQSVIRHAFIEFNGTRAIDANAADVVFEYLDFGTTTQQYLSLDGSSFLVAHCNFPPATAAFEAVHGTLGIPAGGRGIIRDCFFGAVLGYNDTIDFTGGKRPGAILQLINNVFMGTGDDLVDIDGTDAWIEGNIFMHVHKNGSPDSAAAISGGSSGSDVSYVTIVGNIFYNCDSAVTAKEENFYTFINNTVVRQTKEGGDDIEGGVFNLGDEPDEAEEFGAGFYIEGNIIVDAEQLLRNYSEQFTAVTFNNNLMPFAWDGPGSGNSTENPRLRYIPDLSETFFTSFEEAQIVREWFAPDADSPAIGTAAHGRDRGGIVPFGATLSGAPAGVTSATTAVLSVGWLRAAPDIPPGSWPGGSGFTHYRWRIDGGSWSSETPITTPISLAGLANGEHTVEVAAKNDAGFYQDDPVYGVNATVATATWTVDTNYVPPPATPLVRLNEILARNVATLSISGTQPDIIELHNAGNAVADISGWGLTDNPAQPFKYVFPPGTTIAPGGYLVVYASSAGSVPQPKTGFGLKVEGDSVTLTRSAVVGGGIADHVNYGPQLTDFSIGRRPRDGAWDLCIPSFGSANALALQSDFQALRINEWMADAAALFSTDFIELYNASELPVNVGNCYLTDNIVAWPDRHQIPPLSFIPPRGYLVFKADDDLEQGLDHLNFKLEVLQGEIGLFSPQLDAIDVVLYGPQQSDVSEGRTPNGSANIVRFSTPTPGAPNPGQTGSATNTVNLIDVSHVWKYRSANVDLSSTFFAEGFDDSGWNSGGQLLHIEPSNLPSPSGFVKTTALPSNQGLPFNATYFRTRFNYEGRLNGVTLRATIMCDDGAVIYLNGQEVARVRMPAGSITFNTIASESVGNATEEVIFLPTNALRTGENVLAVAVHQQHSGSTQTSSDVVWGMKLDALVPTGSIGLVISEVLALNQSLQNPNGTFHGWIELQNTTDQPIDCGGMSLTNDLSEPRKWIIPAGTTIGPDEFYVTYCNATGGPSATATGFGLNAMGGGVYLFRALEEGGGLLDAVTYGRQIADFSIGRIDGGAFQLCVPTLGAENAGAALAPVEALRINEWLALPFSGDGWFELYNTAAHPVAIGGYYLSDDFTKRAKFRIPDLSFIAGSGTGKWQQWLANNENGGDPGAVNFSLNPAGALLAVYDGDGFPRASTSFGPQVAGVSQGPVPDGFGPIAALVPTPGAMNIAVSADADGDRMLDAWEIANGLNPGDPDDADADPDGDGYTNLMEFFAGTAPGDPANRLTLTIVPNAGGNAVSFTAQDGRTYTVQYRDSLGSGEWLKLLDVPAQAGLRTIEIIDESPGVVRRFYRLATPALP